MKNKICKYVVLLVTLFFLANPLFGQILRFNPLIVGAGLDITENGVTMDIDVTLFRVGIQSYIGLGLGVDLFRYNYISEDHYLCVINPQLFWDILILFPIYSNIICYIRSNF